MTTSRTIITMIIARFHLKSKSLETAPINRPLERGKAVEVEMGVVLRLSLKSKTQKAERQKDKQLRISSFRPQAKTCSCQNRQMKPISVNLATTRIIRNRVKLEGFVWSRRGGPTSSLELSIATLAKMKPNQIHSKLRQR